MELAKTSPLRPVPASVHQSSILPAPYQAQRSERLSTARPLRLTEKPWTGTDLIRKGEMSQSIVGS